MNFVPGRSACWDGQPNDLHGNGDPHPLCSLLLFLLQRKAGRRGPVPPPPAPANGFQQAMLMPGFFPQYPPPPYSMAQNIQPSHAVTMPSSLQASAPSPEAPLPSNPAELPSPAPGSLSFRQLEARVDTLYSIANSALDVVRASRVDTDETQH